MCCSSFNDEFVQGRILQFIRRAGERKPAPFTIRTVNGRMDGLTVSEPKIPPARPRCVTQCVAAIPNHRFYLQIVKNGRRAEKRARGGEAEGNSRNLPPKSGKRGSCSRAVAALLQCPLTFISRSGNLCLRCKRKSRAEGMNIKLQLH